MPNPLENLDQSLGEQIAALNIAGATMAVFDGQQVWRGAAGVLNVETGIEATSDSIFQIGSTTKVMTATLIMRLVGEGRIRLDDPVSAYLPEFKIAAQSPPPQLTVRSLLDFTAGFEADLWDDFGRDPDALEDYVEACARLRFVTAPGRCRSYNTTSFCIAGRLIEKVTAKHFNQALSELLLRPMGAENFCFYDEEVARYRTAIGHKWNPETESIEPEEELRMPPVLSAAGGSVTLDAEGLLQFGLLHLRGGKGPGGEQLIQPELIAQMRRVEDKRPPIASQLGFGWAEMEGHTEGEEITVNVASGATIGHNSLLLVSSEANLALSILANTGMGAHALFQTLGLPLLEELGLTLSLAPPVDEGAANARQFSPEELEGEYFNSAKIRVENTENGLVTHSWHERFGDGRDAVSSAPIERIGGNDYGVFAEGSDQPVGKVTFLSLEGASGEVTHLQSMNRLFKRES